MNAIDREARISLVGAGPGAEDLITVRGLRTLQDADVVLYDALVSEKLLAKIPAGIKKIYVGKRCGQHSLNQQEINTLLVESAFTYGHAVRLKGGDPYVFGRATEEIAYANTFGIPVTVVPGVSSVTAVAASQGIPITKRGVSSSFWVVTATTRDGSFSKDLSLAAQSSATLIILMGIRKMKALSEVLLQHKSPGTPFAILQNGTLENESCTMGTLGTMAEVSNTIDVTQPGILIIGDVVAEHNFFFEDDIQRVLDSVL
ncbi:uroporphyrinogen-III C-methyltransferase [Croceivirga sp. JEA036]|uniref:uroporphyrinogen-III C-methyltransferase n=1 Tax=Croceivirga sp. JEA036 TaxID=2721162 RepID=UPI00143C351F|nr:uroporphyrinogen-III C-methyltransferase [Croceivirga sp. JEA036]NJB36514.1 uroporphyrinogen-III C-methyltransferase [Croceivirga sp. JEA036]